MPRRKQTEGEKKIDISQMAEDLGVSKTTVSRALSGNGRVSEATRARVVQYAKEKNYVPNMLARGLVTQQSYNISLVFSRQFGNLAAPFLRKTVSAVYDIATRNDYDVLMTMVGEQETSPMQRLLVNRQIDGVILARTLERDPLIPMLQKSGIPFVAIGRPADQDVISVDHDQVGGCRELVSLLLMKGLHRIVCWADPCCTPSTSPAWKAISRRMTAPAARLMRACCFWSWKATNYAPALWSSRYSVGRTASCAWMTRLPCWL